MPVNNLLVLWLFIVLPHNIITALLLDLNVLVSRDDLLMNRLLLLSDLLVLLMPMHWLRLLLVNLLRVVIVHPSLALVDMLLLLVNHALFVLLVQKHVLL